MTISQLSKNKYDYVIIGAGPAGLELAKLMVDRGFECLIVSKTLGGEKILSGILPTKFLLKYADVYHSTKDNSVVENIFQLISSDIKLAYEEDLYFTSKIDFVEARAKFLSSNAVELKDINGSVKVVSYRKKCIIATGSIPRMFEIEGVDSQVILNSETFFHLPKLPKSITIIGSGPVSVEFATAMGKVGVFTNLIIKDKLLPDEPRESVKFVRSSLENLGVQIFDESLIRDVNSKSINLVSKSGSQIEIPRTEFYFIAIGRAPNTLLSLDSAKVKYNADGIFVNSEYKTSNESIYAIGDCINDKKSLHLATFQARRVMENILYPYLPQRLPVYTRSIFSDPKISTVGNVISTNPFIKRFRIDFSEQDYVKFEMKYNILAIVFANVLTGRIVGASVVGNGGEDIINFFSLAIQKNLTVFSLRNFSAVYPSSMVAIDKFVDEYFKLYKNEFKTNIRFLYTRFRVQISLLVLWLVLLCILYSFIGLVGHNPYSFVSEYIPKIIKSDYAFLFFILIFIFRSLFGLSAALFVVVGSAIFGFFPGIIYSIIGLNLSSILNYTIGNYFGNYLSAEKNILKNYLSNKTFATISFLRIFFFPFDITSYLAGLYKLNLYSFALATFISSLPAVIAFSIIGTSIDINHIALTSLITRFGYYIVAVIILGLIFTVGYNFRDKFIKK